MGTKRVTLWPASRAAVRISDGAPVVTVPDESECGPSCPGCSLAMQPWIEGRADLVRCVNTECMWAMAPFKSSMLAVKPTDGAEDGI